MTAALALMTSVVALGVVASLAMERLVRPVAPGVRRDASSALIVAGSHGAVLAMALLLTQRVVFAAALALSVQLLLVLVSNAKYRALREPFVFTDFGLFSQALRHPRLYLPFLGARRALLAAAAFAAAVYVGLAIEPPSAGAVGVGTAVLALAAAAIAAGLRHAPAVRFDPFADLARIGLLASLWLYWREERRRPGPVVSAPWLSRSRVAPGPHKDDLPHIVVVQSESFFDARRLHPDIRCELLSNFDNIKQSALHHGRLQVPAWGANTMRTEFAFLAGIGADALGVHRFNPYRHAARRSRPALPWYLRERGYRTVCVHPHPAGFFQRHRVLPNLGFDEFVDIAAFGDAPRAGPYVADEAVTRQVMQILQNASEPTFVFAITMENHGPLHLQSAEGVDTRRLFTRAPPGKVDELIIYLQHLANADRMAGDLLRLLRRLPREGLLCFFGDHVPSMPAVYDALGFADPRTDYVVWREGAAAAAERDLRVEHLGELVVTAAFELAQAEPAIGRAR